MSFIGELARLAILAQAKEGGGNGAQGTGGILELIFHPLVLPFLLLGIFWFMILRPYQQREAEREKMRKELKTYDKVVTAGGILGTITEIRDNDEVVTLRIDEKTGAEIRVFKAYIMRPEDMEDEDEKEKKKGDDTKETEKKSA